MAESSKSTGNSQKSSTSASTTPAPVTSTMTTTPGKMQSPPQPTMPASAAPTPSSAPGSESDAGDTEFEPTAEMMMDEFDDERTLDEAEAEAANEGEDQEEEISNLQKEQDMPLEELLAMYGAGGAAATNGGEEEAMEEGGEEEEEEEEEDDEEEEDSMPVDGGRNKQIVPKTREARHSAGTEGSSSNVTSTPISGGGGGGHHHHSTPSRGHQSLEGSGGRAMERRGRRRESDLIQLYPEMEAANGEGGGSQHRALRSSGQQSEDEDDDDGGGPGGGDGGGGEGGESGGEEGEPEEYRKTIMIGSAYQAQVPEGMQAYGATPPYENQDKLLWAPHLLSIDEVERYLYTVHQPPPGAQGVGALPLGLHIRDDEQALHLLLQCGGNVDEARRRHSMNPTPLASTMTLWSEEECRTFENGLKNYGKDFHLIQQNKVRTRSVGELVQFYYLWKKTERHDMFAAKTRLEKKKFIVHPGTTDYMDRFLDEGEGLLAAITNNNNNNNTSSNNNNNNQTPSPSVPSSSSSSSNSNMNTPLTPSATSSNTTNSSSGDGAGGSSSTAGDGGDTAGNNDSNKAGSSHITINIGVTTTPSSDSAGTAAQPVSATSTRTQSVESNGVDFDDSSSNGSNSKHSGGGGSDGARSGGGSGTTSSSTVKKDYIIPSMPPSETGKQNQQLWRENQRPNVAMHALLYGVLPAGYKTKEGVGSASAAAVAAATGKNSSFKGNLAATTTRSVNPTTVTKEVRSFKGSEDGQRPAKIPRLESPFAGDGDEKMEVDDTVVIPSSVDVSTQGINSSSQHSGKIVTNSSPLAVRGGVGVGLDGPLRSSAQQPGVATGSPSISPRVTSSVSLSSPIPSVTSVSSPSQKPNASTAAPVKSTSGKPVSLKRGEMIVSATVSALSSSPKVPNSSSHSQITSPAAGQSPRINPLVSSGGGSGTPPPRLNSPSSSSRQGSPRISSPTLNRSGSSKPLARIDLIAQTLSREKALATGTGASSTSPLAATAGSSSNKSPGYSAGGTTGSIGTTIPSSPVRPSSNSASASIRGVAQFSGMASSTEKAVL